MSIGQRFRAFFNPQEVKVNPAYAGIIQYSDTPKPVSMDKDYKSFAKEGYRNNDTVYKAISYIARNGAAIKPVLYTNDKCEDTIDSHPLLDKLNKPNDEQSGVSYREAVIAYKLLSGNAYQYAVRPMKNSIPVELWALRPDAVQVIPDKKRGIVGFQYANMEIPIPAQNIGHTKYFHPLDDLYGMSPLEAAAVHVDQNKAAKLWNLSLLQNSARPPGAWTVPVAMTKNDRDRLEQRLKEKLQGYKNAGAPPILDAGLQWQSLGLPPGQLEWLAGIQYNAVIIANVYNIPPQLIGDNSSSTYNNMKEAKLASYTEAIFPELDDLYALYNTWLVPMYADLASKGAYLYYDKASVEVVQEVIQANKTAKVTQANTLWMNGLATQNEAREVAGLPSTPQGNVYRIGGILVPADKVEEYAEQSLTTPAGPPMPVAEPVSQNEQNDGNTNNDQTTSKDPGNNKPTTGEDNPDKTPGANNGAAQKFILPEGIQAPLQAREHDLSLSPGRLKTLDKNGVYQPDDLDKQLETLKAKGVEFVKWVASKSCCDVCGSNDGVTRPVGAAFPSGHILPSAHPNCECEVIPAQSSSKSYRDFVKAHLYE